MQPITGGNGHQLFADINDLLNVKAPIIKEAYCASHHATFHHPIHHMTTSAHAARHHGVRNQEECYVGSLFHCHALAPQVGSDQAHPHINQTTSTSACSQLLKPRENVWGLGSIKVLNQLGHPEKRKSAADYDEHERYNAKVDALTHAITPDMPLYISFRRLGRRQTQLWYEPTEHENVGHGTCHEVTGDVYRYITKSAQRRASISRIVKHCGEFHATFERGVTGRSPTEPGPTISKILDNNLPTEPRVSMWGGVQAGTLTCGCGQVLQWSDRDGVVPLQWHSLQCTLAAETSVRRRWRAAIKRTIVAAAPDLVVACCRIGSDVLDASD